MVALFDGKPVGTAGLSSVGTQQKQRHREDTDSGLGCTCRCCWLCPLELEAVKDNDRAIGLYKCIGFEICGKCTRFSVWIRRIPDAGSDERLVMRCRGDRQVEACRS